MSATKTFLLELHCEEIPARFLKPLHFEFSQLFFKFLEKESLVPAGASVSANGFVSDALPDFLSPRKLAWRISGIPTSQPDQTETQVGPPQRMCVDEAGKPTIQGEKFAEKWGVPFSAVRFEQPAGKKEPCAVVTLTKQGRPTADLLTEALPGLIAGLHVPKAMRWGRSEFEFVRPIRNILCLLGDQVVPLQVDGVQASNTTWGHRLFHRAQPAPVAIPAPEAYEAALEAAGVVVSVDVRRARMAEQLEALATEVGGRVVADAELLDTLAEIVEFPKIVRGDFPASFLELPKEVLVTSLREHQKSFCIEQADGTLLPFFLTAANRTDDPAGFVKAGNEWVLKARLYDARFFFAEDLKHPLSDRLEKLQALTFQRDLGSYHAKTGRVVALVKGIATRLSSDETHVNRALEAARMAKCDLRTLMVGEFPELQGVMGGEYLKHEGAHEDVWMAVKEHYRPVGAEDAIPSTPMGCLLSLCDKLDTVAGCFAVGLIPSGSKDPLALRRAGQGIVRILWERGWDLSPSDLITVALGVVGAKATKPAAETKEALLAFFRDRVAYQLEVAGYAGSVRRSALAAGWEDLTDLKARCEALSAFAEDPRFASLAQSAKRIGNILKDETPSTTFDAALLTQAEEKALAEQLGHLEGTPDQAALLTALADLAEPLEAFFNAVMVKCEDPALRAARLSLLHRLRQAFLRVADFSLWQ
ncbi:glycine--tRNA ligase beta subunit [Geothrix limicola]|uniref:Glycine--tRNA ligase beta subunit n=1 Tax=Geothrix limicola TaxID=2927978 RepID=A0ABQ5QAX8_9BACT|nr:glycine--tRNA ligase subunit beta [Geothrix limicola]GLH71862.1 glycine--tRNA ligase beta subunit [Geothrix limicola]